MRLLLKPLHWIYCIYAIVVFVVIMLLIFPFAFAASSSLTPSYSMFPEISPCVTLYWFGFERPSYALFGHWPDPWLRK